MPTLEGERREGSCSLATRGGLPVYEEQYHYIVKADSVTQERVEIIATPGLPTPGPNGSTTANGFAVCTTLNATRREANALYWDVTATFTSEVDEGIGATTLVPGTPQQTSPTEWVPVYETKMERTQEVVAKDIDGVAVANSAGFAFETGLTIGRYIPIWDLYQFEPDTVTDEDIIDRNETTNEVTFKGKAAGTLLLTVVDSVIWRYLGQRVRLTRYEVRFNERNWKHKRYDVGPQYLDVVALNIVAKDFLSADGSPMLGNLLQGGQGNVGDPPNVLEFTIYNELDFHDFLRT